MSPILEQNTFTVSAAPRHPYFQELAYDQKNHRYHPTYIAPESWTLFLNACPSTTTRPAGVVRYKWTISHADNAFWPLVVEKTHPFDCRAEAQVPETGHLKITLETFTEVGKRQVAHKNFHLRDRLIVALGDSYACGEGVPDRPGEVDPATQIECNSTLLTKILQEKADMGIHLAKNPDWQEPEAHRSYESGISRGVREFEDPENGLLTTFLTYACSGAGIKEGFLEPQMGWQNVGQVREAYQHIAGRRKTDALVLTGGGNDVDFGWALRTLAKPELKFGGLIDLGKSRASVVRAAHEKLEKLPERLDRLAAEIQRRLNPKHVFLFEYPTAMFDVSHHDVSDGCGIFDSLEVLQITKSDARQMKDFGTQLNTILYQAANRNGWIFIDGIAAGFSGHGYCSDDSFYVLAEDSCKVQGDFRGTMHPNTKGHQVYARRLVAALSSWLV